MGIDKYLLRDDESLTSIPDLQSLEGVDLLLQALAVVVYFTRHGIPNSFCFKGNDRWEVSGCSDMPLKQALPLMLPDFVIEYLHDEVKLDHRSCDLVQFCDLAQDGAGFELEVGHFITMDTTKGEVFLQKKEDSPICLKFMEDGNLAYWQDVELGVSSSNSQRVEGFGRSVKDIIKGYIRVMEHEKAREAEIRKMKQAVMEIERREVRENELRSQLDRSDDHDER